MSAPITFDNSYADLPDSFYTRQGLQPVDQPTLLKANLDLADQFEEISLLLEKNSDFSIGKVLFFINSPILLSPPTDFQQWVDACAHFADAMLFIGRNNENAGFIKSYQDRYSTLRYPMESIVLGKKNNPWARILESFPRRISHIFDSPELLETEDQPEMDRYLVRLPSGHRKHTIPLVFKKSLIIPIFLAYFIGRRFIDKLGLKAFVKKLHQKYLMIISTQGLEVVS
mgnify:CR=1 FL=1